MRVQPVKPALFLILLGVLSHDVATAQTQDGVAVEYYYKVKWGHAEEFIQLYRKNHYPILESQVQSGRFLRVFAERPRYHMTEVGRWDYRVTIVFRDAAAERDPGNEAEMILRLYPDQETFRREEQRRFEILEGHWDLPLENVELRE